MIKFHHGITGGPIVDIYQGDKLLVSSLSPFETSTYVSVDHYKQITSYAGETLIFKLRLKSNCSATVVIYIEGSDIKLGISKDDDHLPDMGEARVRKIQFNSLVSSNLTPYKVETQTLNTLGINTIQIDSSTASIEVINQGIYTVFFNGQNTPTAVLYNIPPQYGQTPFNFQDYIGKWYVIISLGIPTDVKSYTFYENSRGRFMLMNDNTPIPAADVSVQPNFVGFVQGYDEEQGKLRTLSGLLVGDVQSSLDPGTSVFSWIVHDTDYCNYSLNGSPSRQQMVILSRETTLCKKTKKRLLCKAKTLGYNTNNLNL